MHFYKKIYVDMSRGDDYSYYGGGNLELKNGYTQRDALKVTVASKRISDPIQLNELYYPDHMVLDRDKNLEKWYAFFINSETSLYSNHCYYKGIGRPEGWNYEFNVGEELKESSKCVHGKSNHGNVLLISEKHSITECFINEYIADSTTLKMASESANMVFEPEATFKMYKYVTRSIDMSFRDALELNKLDSDYGWTNDIPEGISIDEFFRRRAVKAAFADKNKEFNDYLRFKKNLEDNEKFGKYIDIDTIKEFEGFDTEERIEYFKPV